MRSLRVGVSTDTFLRTVGRERPHRATGYRRGTAVSAVPVAVLLVVDGVAPSVTDVVHVALPPTLETVGIWMPDTDSCTGQFAVQWMLATSR